MSLAGRLMIRTEDVRDPASIHAVNEVAFARRDEADLIDRLRDEGAVLESDVAELDASVIGHILFSRLWIDTAGGAVAAVALAPMAVAPAQQRLGVGGRLIHDGLDRLRERGEQAVIVLGHQDYYSRFGFSSARARALTHLFPPEALMALELTPGALDDVRGTLRYANAFGL